MCSGTLLLELLGVLLEQLPGRLRQFLGNCDLYGNQEVARFAACSRHAFSAYSKDLAAPGSRGHFEFHRTVQCRNIDGRAECRLRKRDRQSQSEVLPVASEVRVRRDMNSDYEISLRAAVASRSALPTNPNRRGVGYTGRNPDLHSSRPHFRAAAPTSRTGLFDEFAVAPTLRTGLRDREESLALSHRSGAAAGWTDLHRRSRFSS